MFVLIQYILTPAFQKRRCRGFYIFVLALALVFPGCMKAGPDFHRPEAPVSANWMDAGDSRLKSESADYRNWWQIFGDPVLNGLVDKAYRDNLTLRIAGVRVLEARALLGIAIGEFFPQTQQVSGSFGYSHTSAQSQTGIGELDFLRSQIGANAVWELDFWGKFRRAIESADAGWHASAADYDNALVTLTADVATSYISIRTLEKRIEIARQNAESQKETLQIAEARFRYGVVTELDVQQATAALESTMAAIPSLETQLRQAKHALSVLLGLAPGELSDYLKDSSEIPAAPPEIVVGIPADLLRRRPDIRSAEYQAASQSARIGVAKADLYPSFSLVGSLSFLSTDIGRSKLSDMFRWDSRNVQAGLSSQWSIFNYGRIANNVRLQDARLQELLIAYQDTVLRAQQEVEDNLISFLKARERAEFLARSTAAAKKALDLAVLQYRQGIKDFTTVLTAQQALLNEQDSFTVTLGNISISLTGVYRALGGGWEIREGKELVPPQIKEEMAKRTEWGRLLEPASYNPPHSDKPKSLSPDW